MPQRYSPAPTPGDIEPPVLRAYLDQEFRRIAGSQQDELLEGAAILYGTADNVVANDTTETPILNYASSFSDTLMEVDPVLGTITLPDKPGLANLSVWTSLEQVTNTRNFTVQLELEVNGVWSTPILGSGYIPQQGSDVRLGISASLTRAVVGGEVFRLGLILDGATPATFSFDDGSFELRYLTVRG